MTNFCPVFQYTVLPTRRSLAQAIQILISHLFGDASSPYIIGAISDGIRGNSESLVSKFISLQYSMYLPQFVLVLGSISFLVCSSYVEEDQKACLALTQGNFFVVVFI
ncbi:SPNS3 [Cordylochernes scorpioides]|uniref:SPNS3 n=1 Tax=Cordylochernes scorpioides TaxID=51811 RepID=A0ABY6K823_9ARAC|nr:SPNS3 [Cordylochernes scorpioides]